MVKLPCSEGGDMEKQTAAGLHLALCTCREENWEATRLLPNFLFLSSKAHTNLTCQIKQAPVPEQDESLNCLPEINGAP